MQFTHGGDSSSRSISSTAAIANVAISFEVEQSSGGQPILQPCRVEISPEQQQQQQRQLLPAVQHAGQQLQKQPLQAEQEQQQLWGLQAQLQDSLALSYTAYFRPLPRDMCGTTPKVGELALMCQCTAAPVCARNTINRQEKQSAAGNATSAHMDSSTA